MEHDNKIISVDVLVENNYLRVVSFNDTQVVIENDFGRHEIFKIVDEIPADDYFIETMDGRYAAFQKSVNPDRFR